MPPPVVPPPAPAPTTAPPPASASDPAYLACTRASNGFGVNEIASELQQVYGIAENEAVNIAQQALTAVLAGGHFCDAYLGVLTNEVAFIGVESTRRDYRCCTVRYRQMAPMSDLSMSDIVVDFSASMQSLGALQEAAYRLIGQAACQIDEADGRYVCRLSPSQPQLQGDELRTHFLNLVTDENLREKVEQRD